MPDVLFYSPLKGLHSLSNINYQASGWYNKPVYFARFSKVPGCDTIFQKLVYAHPGSLRY